VSQTDLTISPSHPSYDRIDLVVVNSDGVASVITGTPEVEPHTPDYDPESYVVLARVFVDDLATSIPQSKITDIRVINSGVGSFGKYVTSVSNQTNVNVNHYLGDSEPVVVCYDDNNNYVIPQSITVNSPNQVNLTFNPEFTGKIIVQGGAGWSSGGGGGGGGGGGSLTVKEEDGTPTVSNVYTIKVSNNTLTDEGGGVVKVNLDGNPGSYIYEQSTPNTTWNVTHNLNQQVVSVMCYDDSDTWIQPHSIQLNNSNQLTITFLSPTAGKAIIRK
jgi:hypothetical protein